MRRTDFVKMAAAGTMLAGLPRKASAQLAVAATRAPRKSLVLSGGANRGAYQAGVIQALVDKAGLKDGEPLDYDLICGTSIGALNSYLVATAKYRKLRDAWFEIPSLNVAEPKDPYGKIRDSSSGVLSRLFAAFSLGWNLTRNKAGVLNPDGVNHILNDFVQPSDTVHLPLYVATTNLTRMRGEIFVRRATTPLGLQKQAINDRILANYRLSAIRPATDDVVRSMLFASAAIPVAFDPILLPSIVEPGTYDSFVDGGVTENVPVEIARRCAQTVNVLLVDPANPNPDIPARTGIDVANGTFGTMQRRILELQIALAIAESYAIANAGSGRTDNRLALDGGYIRPSKPLPGSIIDFNNAKILGEMWQTGYDDGIRGWTKYDFPDPLKGAE